MEQLLGALQQEFGDLESEQASDSDDGQGSGTEQGTPACSSVWSAPPPPPPPSAPCFYIGFGQRAAWDEHELPIIHAKRHNFESVCCCWSLSALVTILLLALKCSNEVLHSVKVSCIGSESWGWV